MANLATVLPLAFVMIAGPQIISSIFFATSDRWRSDSAAYIAGAALAITVVVSVAYFVAKGLKSSASSSNKGSVKTGIDIAVIALLAFAAVYVFVKKRHADPPKWMGKLQSAGPRFAFTLGVLLLGVFPSDLVTSAGVGAHLAAHDNPWWHCLVFVGTTVAFLALPFVLLLVLGQRARNFMPKARGWMNDNSWIVSEFVIVLFIAITAASL